MQLYIKLFHGRPTPDTQLDDWGTNGPILGPFAYVHLTYMCDVKICYGAAEHEDSFTIYEDLLYYDGVFYGDFSITTLNHLGNVTPEVYDPAKSTLPDPYIKIQEAKRALKLQSAKLQDAERILKELTDAQSTPTANTSAGIQAVPAAGGEAPAQDV